MIFFLSFLRISSFLWIPFRQFHEILFHTNFNRFHFFYSSVRLILSLVSLICYYEIHIISARIYTIIRSALECIVIRGLDIRIQRGVCLHWSRNIRCSGNRLPLPCATVTRSAGSWSWAESLFFILFNCFFFIRLMFPNASICASIAVSISLVWRKGGGFCRLGLQYRVFYRLLRSKGYGGMLVCKAKVIVLFDVFVSGMSSFRCVRTSEDIRALARNFYTRISYTILIF